MNDPLTTYRASLESNGVETRPVIVIGDAIHPAARDRLSPRRGSWTSTA